MNGSPCLTRTTDSGKFANLGSKAFEDDDEDEDDFAATTLFVAILSLL
jgi:hypothetical protein